MTNELSYRDNNLEDQIKKRENTLAVVDPHFSRRASPLDGRDSLLVLCVGKPF